MAEFLKSYEESPEEDGDTISPSSTGSEWEQGVASAMTSDDEETVVEGGNMHTEQESGNSWNSSEVCVCVYVCV